MSQRPPVIGHGFWGGTDEDVVLRAPPVPEEGTKEVVLNMPWDWPPGSPGARALPACEFTDWLRNFYPSMGVFWQPVAGVWVIWNEVSEGEWSCVFPVADPFSGGPLPFDNRIKALLIDSDPRTYGGEKEMIEWLADRAEADERERKSHTLDALESARRQAKRHVQIRTGYGYSPGNKAALHDTEGRGI